MSGYDPKSCNALQKPFYRPVEAAIRWCGLIADEAEILAGLNSSDMIPKTRDFPQWPCLQANTEKILDAIRNDEIPHGRDGKTVSDGDHVAPARLTVRHTDLRTWVAKYYPDQKPAFLFDETERTTHQAINADSFRALQADRDAARAELKQASVLGERIISERDALLDERDSLHARVEQRAYVPAKERQSLLLLFAAMAKQAKFDLEQRGVAAAIARAVDELGASMSEDTAAKYIKEARAIVEERRT